MKEDSGRCTHAQLECVRFQFLGEYTTQAVIQTDNVVQMLCCTFVFALPLKKKPKYPLRVALTMLCCLLFVATCVVVRTRYTNMLTRYFVTLLQYASTFPVLYCCYEESVITLLQTVCAALASENICSALFAVLLFFAGADDTIMMSFFGVSDTPLDWGIYYLIHLLTLLALCLLFGRVPRETADEKSRKALTFLSIGIFLAITVLSSFVSQHRAESPEAMTIYEEKIKTGNDVLDTVMYENQVLCKQAGIRLSCLADGELLSFMQTRHLYAIFSNALRNAIEAASVVENPEKRVVSMTVGAHNDTVEISIINYFSGQVQLCNGLPAVTSKAERNQHGFGIKSITYAAAQYKGTVKATVEDDVFSLLITIPIPKENKAKRGVQSMHCIAIVEDDEHAATLLTSFLNRYAKEKQEEFSIRCYAHPVLLLEGYTADVDSYSWTYKCPA